VESKSGVEVLVQKRICHKHCTYVRLKTERNAVMQLRFFDMEKMNEIFCSVLIAEQLVVV
jgi:predicted transcriptional regulator